MAWGRPLSCPYCIDVPHARAGLTLRVLLWVSVLLLPLVGGCWTLALLSVGDEPPALRLAFPPLCCLTGLYVFLGYCILNKRVRHARPTAGSYG